MIKITIPGRDETLEIAHLVLDFNGTLALDGMIKPGVAALLRELAESLQVHIVTAGTFGGVEDEVRGIPCRLKILQGADQTGQKARYVEELGAEHTACVGNGRNDRAMLEARQAGHPGHPGRRGGDREPAGGRRGLPRHRLGAAAAAAAAAPDGDPAHLSADAT